MSVGWKLGERLFLARVFLTPAYRACAASLFLGSSPGNNQPIILTFVVGRDARRRRVQLAFGLLPTGIRGCDPASCSERRYALHEVKQRLEQASFREIVLAAF
jgi:putative restriction endonuclease